MPVESYPPEKLRHPKVYPASYAKGELDGPRWWSRKKTSELSHVALPSLAALAAASNSCGVAAAYCPAESPVEAPWTPVSVVPRIVGIGPPYRTCPLV